MVDAGFLFLLIALDSLLCVSIEESLLFHELTGAKLLCSVILMNYLLRSVKDKNHKNANSLYRTKWTLMLITFGPIFSPYFIRIVTTLRMIFL